VIAPLLLPVPSLFPLPLALFFFLLSRRPPISPLFPYTTLFRSRAPADVDELYSVAAAQEMVQRRETLIGKVRNQGALVADLADRSEEHTSELQSLTNLVCRLLLEKKKNNKNNWPHTREGCDTAS